MINSSFKATIESKIVLHKKKSPLESKFLKVKPKENPEENMQYCFVAVVCIIKIFLGKEGKPGWSIGVVWTVAGR